MKNVNFHFVGTKFASFVAEGLNLATSFQNGISIYYLFRFVNSYFSFNCNCCMLLHKCLTQNSCYTDPWVRLSFLFVYQNNAVTMDSSSEITPTVSLSLVRSADR